MRRAQPCKCLKEQASTALSCTQGPCRHPTPYTHHHHTRHPPPAHFARTLALPSLRCRVDTVPALPTLDHAALLRAATGLLSGTGTPAHATGSAAFLLASMLNHSCEPNLEVGRFVF